MVTYGSDEVQAITLDVGSYTTRAGYSGEDTPKCIIPSSYGSVDDRLYFGQAGPSVYRGKDLQIKNPLQDSIIQDWDAAEKLVEYALKDGMRMADLREHPLLVTEPAWTPKENREKMMELAFEQWQTPAYYSVDRAVASAFAAGRGTALVIDIGQTSSSIVPIYDGFVIRKSIKRSPLSASLLNSLLSHAFQNTPDPNNPSQPISVIPQYLVKSKTLVELSKPPQAILRQERMNQVSPSFQQYARESILHEFKENICEVFPQRWNEQQVQLKGAKSFEFPDGFNMLFGPNPRLTMPEVFFNPQAIIPKEMTAQTLPASNATIPLPALSQAVPLHQSVLEAVQSTDADLQSLLLGNIVIVGGTTLLPGFTERLSNELTAASPGVKPKLSASGVTVERKYATWLGGSILSSLGSFHQLWISKQEYDEQGKSVIHRRAR